MIVEANREVDWLTMCILIELPYLQQLSQTGTRNKMISHQHKKNRT